MTDILDEVLRFLKEEAVFTLPNVTVKEAYLVNTDLDLPLLTVDELPGNDGVYLDNQPRVVHNLITLEAYASQLVFEDPASGEPVLLTGKRAAYRLLEEADKQLNARFGLTMTGSIAYAPYEDTNVVRVQANYFAYIDTRTNLIYRRINT